MVTTQNEASFIGEDSRTIDRDPEDFSWDQSEVLRSDSNLVDVDIETGCCAPSESSAALVSPNHEPARRRGPTQTVEDCNLPIVRANADEESCIANEGILPPNTNLDRSLDVGAADGAHRWSISTFYKEARAQINKLSYTPPVLYSLGILALFPVVDIVTDIITAAKYAWEGHLFWAITSLVIFFLSARFTALFFSLHPTPRVHNLLVLYVPGLWYLMTRDEGDDESGRPATPTAGPAEPGEPLNENDNTQGVSGGRFSIFYPVQICNTLNNLLDGTTERLNDTIYVIIEGACHKIKAQACPARIFLALGFEIVLLPFAILVIIPVMAMSLALMRSYFEEAEKIGCCCLLGPFPLCNSPDHDQGEDSLPDGGRNAPAEQVDAASEENAVTLEETTLRREHNLRYLQTLSIVEALFESFLQIILQVKFAFAEGNLTDWVFCLSVAISSVCVAKAVFAFCYNYKEIIKVLTNIDGAKVVAFKTLEIGTPPPQGGGWGMATAREVRYRRNRDLLPGQYSGLGPWHIAALADGMKVGGINYGYKVERRGTTEGVGHALYSRRR